MRIILIRHGEADYEKDCLTEKGKKQAQAAAERLRHEKLSVIYSSPCGRALETAAPTAAICGRPVQTLEFLREIEMSDLPEQEPWALAKRIVAKEDFLFTFDNWKTHPAFAENIVTKAYEHVSDCTDRFLSELGYRRTGNRYLFLGEDSGKTVALFCHIGSGSCVLSHLLNLPFPLVCGSFRWNNAGISILRFEEESGGYALPILETLNDTGFLQTVQD